MKVDVIQLMSEGRSLSRDELDGAPRIHGNLVIEWWTEGNALKRPLQRARLKGFGHGDPPDLVAPIFEPTIGKVTEDRMFIRGVQMISEAGTTRQVIQEWMLRPCRSE
jgi:hypothetical protein